MFWMQEKKTDLEKSFACCLNETHWHTLRSVLSSLCKAEFTNISQFDDFRMLTQKVGFNYYETAFIEQDYPNHTHETLETCSMKN